MNKITDNTKTTSLILKIIATKTSRCNRDFLQTPCSNNLGPLLKNLAPGDENRESKKSRTPRTRKNLYRTPGISYLPADFNTSTYTCNYTTFDNENYS